MVHISLAYRLKTFTRTITVCLLLILIIFFATLLIGSYSYFSGGVFALVSLILVLLAFHVQIGKAFLIRGSGKLLHIFLVILLSFSLLYFKIWVNENIVRYCVDTHPSDIAELVNYLGFFFWTSFLICEIYVFFLSKKHLKNERNLR